MSDISCDINGSIEFLDRTCTIANPFFQYNPLTREEVCADIGDKGITVMGEYLFSRVSRLQERYVEAMLSNANLFGL